MEALVYADHYHVHQGSYQRYVLMGLDVHCDVHALLFAIGALKASLSEKAARLGLSYNEHLQVVEGQLLLGKAASKSSNTKSSDVNRSSKKRRQTEAPQYTRHINRY